METKSWAREMSRKDGKDDSRGLFDRRCGGQERGNAAGRDPRNTKGPVSGNDRFPTSTSGSV